MEDSQEHISWSVVSKIAKQIKEAGIQTLFIQSGEDPNIDKIVEEVLPKIKKELKINNIILCLGNRSKKQYKKFKQSGANAYILKFETSDSKLFQKIRHEPLKQRLQCLKWLKKLGFEIGTGNIIGVPGQTIESIAEDILLAKKLNTDFVSAAPFISNENTPFENMPCVDFNLTLNTIAILRILLKDVLIPTVSALEKIKKGGQLFGFNAGANVITVNFTPPRYRKKYLIYSKSRFIVSLNHALKTIKLANLKPDTYEIVPKEMVLSHFESKFEKKFKPDSVYYSRKEPGTKIFIKRLKEKKKEISVLDLGCADGRLSIKYAQNGFKVVGIDFSSNAIKRLKERARYYKVSNLVNGRVGNITKINYGANEFDGVACSNTLHYFDNEELEEIIKKMKEATKDNGLNYISFQSELHTELPNGRGFRFENQTYWKAEVKYPKSEVKYTKAGFEPLTETIIRNDKIGIIVWTDKPLGVIIHQKEAAESYDKFFQLMWGTAKS